MTVSSSRSPGLVPVHVGQPVPNGLESGRPPQPKRRSGLADPGFEWQKHGVEPRWLGMETSDCAAALDPSVFHSHGADEWQRFLAGAGGRHETALVIATVGNAEDDSPRSVLSRYDASVNLPDDYSTAYPRRLGGPSR